MLLITVRACSVVLYVCTCMCCGCEHVCRRSHMINKPKVARRMKWPSVCRYVSWVCIELSIHMLDMSVQVWIRARKSYYCLTD